MPEPRKPSPNFYKIMAIAFLVIGGLVIWAAVVRHEWVYWALGIMTIINAGMAWLKSLVPRETKR
jgi:Na+/H+ antiporter NhaB